MTDPQITFIGGGNMARSLVGGLIADGCPPASIRITDPDAEQRQRLHDRFGVETLADNHAAIRDADVVVLAVKPQVMQSVCVDLASAAQQQRPLMISIAAGVLAPSIDHWLGGGLAVVRSMPNTPSLVQSGATGLYANKRVDDTQREMAESILRAVGMVVWVDSEAQLDAVTALSGSGPAYFFLVMEAMEKAAQQLGLDADKARLLTLQTAFGAAKMALESDEGPDSLRVRVTSPGGTTEQALNVLREGGLEALFADALQAACRRAEELGQAFGSDS